MKLKILGILLFCMISHCVDAQLVTIQGIPRDTSFTLYSAWVGIKAKFPEAKAVIPHLPDGVTADNDMVYAIILKTPVKKRELHLDLFRPKKAG